MLRLINLALLLSFLICYLEWGQDNSSFVFQTEYLLLFKKSEAISTLIHPLIIIPFIGQLLIMYTLFQKIPGRTITIIGLILLSILVLLIAFVGILSLNVKIILSTLPFILIGVLILFKRKEYKSNTFEKT